MLFNKRRIVKSLFTATLCLLFGCEAPLNLKGVEQELSRVLHRYDQFQAVARSKERIVVVGAAGAVIISGDGGDHWQRGDIPDRPSLIDVTACPDGHFLALDVGRKVWRSTEVGLSALQWQSQALPTFESVMALYCDVNNDYWVVAGFSTILHSNDGGESWSEESQGDDTQFTSVQFVSPTVAFIAGEFGTVLKSVNGGNSWERLADIPGEFYPQDMYFIDAEQGWVVGLNGTIYHTKDGGQHWQTQPTGVQMPLYGITAAGKQLYAVGENGLVLGYQGGRWQPVAHKNHVLSYLRGAIVSKDRLVVAGGNGTLLTLAAAPH